MNHYGIAFERKILSVFTDFEAMLEQNPLGKVPVLVLDNNEYIFDSRMIIDYLDRSLPAESRLVPADSKQRRQVQRLEAVALGLAEKCYERGIEFARRQPDSIDADWAARLKTQITSALNWLEDQEPEPWLHGDSITQADITCAVAFTYLREKQQITLARGDFPSLDQHCDYCESLAAFTSSPYSATEAARSGWQARE